MLDREDGKVMVVNDVHSRTAELPTAVMPSAKVTDVRPVQP